MDKRKLILFGTNSFVISLPKIWIDKNNLKKGDIVNLSESDNEIIINTNIQKKELNDSIDIKIDDKKINIIRTELVTAYLRGFNNINIIGKSLTKNILKIRTIVSKLPGLEIMDTFPEIISIKNLLNESSVSLDEILMRTNNMIISMINDSIINFEKDLSENISERDNDINRMVFLSFRVLRKALKNNSFAKTLNLSPDKIIMLWEFFLRIEKIGDQNKRISKIISNQKINYIDEIKEILIELKNQYSCLYDSFISKENVNILNLATEGKSSIIEKCNLILEKPNDYYTFKVIENLKNMSVSIEHIAQVLLTVM